MEKTISEVWLKKQLKQDEYMVQVQTIVTIYIGSEYEHSSHLACPLVGIFVCKKKTKNAKWVGINSCCTLEMFWNLSRNKY